MPSQAQATDVTRIQQLGLDLGAVTPLHFVVESDLHIDIPGIALHRTVRMPPTDEIGVTPAAAYIAYCTHATLLDAIAIGDWLLKRNHMTLGELSDLVLSWPARDGAAEVRYLYGMLVERSRSLPESRVRMLLLRSGIAGLEVNAPLTSPAGRPLELDLLARRWNLAIEYEGAHHQEDRDQYLIDIDRHAALRAMHLEYLLITKEHMRNAHAMVRMVHSRLVSLGYDGPEPDFGRPWRDLFRPVRALVRRDRLQPATRGELQPVRPMSAVLEPTLA